MAAYPQGSTATSRNSSRVEIISLHRETKQYYDSAKSGIKPVCHLSTYSAPPLSLPCSLSLCGYTSYVITRKWSGHETPFPSLPAPLFLTYVSCIDTCIHIRRSLEGTPVQVIWMLSLESSKSNVLMPVHTHTHTHTYAHTPLLFVVSEWRSLPGRQEVWM